ncbi:proto-oncogene Mas-like [Rhineura floridana]|uniref:proto-oncogene Mas-like n=1 Tax=Rhineura floridana TaxID=261503 RepID=UPI002AC808A9|nr:proto-oncogene Mas-like [Rhineura floridana]XP_061463906.1 proto-oncogene Mas-like [Rhineura floridana]
MQRRTVMSNSTLELLFSLDAAGEDYETHNETGFPNTIYFCFYLNDIGVIFTAFISVISLFGLMGNGTVIWFLGFRMKRNPFTFILNLAVSDLGVLIFTILLRIIICESVHFSHSVYWLGLFCLHVFFFMYFTGQYLLTAISIDRCVSVLFPIWHQCHRPSGLSTVVCAIIWIFCFLLCLIYFTLEIMRIADIVVFQFLITGGVCFPLMTISTLVLFIKVCFRSQQRRQGKVLRAILLALLFFALPFNFMYLFGRDSFFLNVGFVCSCLNSSVNQLINFLVGRKKNTRSRESMKVILQRLFKEEKDC